MKEYHKIQSVFKRDLNTKRFTEEYSMPEFELLHDIQWLWTEKVDGTNIRIHWDGAGITLGGRTDNAQIPATLISVLQKMFTPEKMMQTFGARGGITLYGEGYGDRIQSGGAYRPDQSFILFDICGGDIWFSQTDMAQIALSLGIDVVPTVGIGGLSQAISYVKSGAHSMIARTERPPIAEGIVLRPGIELRTRRGDRIITKLKYKDFA